MSDPRSAEAISGYHAHIYYRNDAEKAEAALLRSQIRSSFDVTMGRWRDMPVGPHTAPMYQVAFDTDQFAAFVPWLMLNRRDLSVLVHPETGHQVADHIIQPLWLGESLPVKLEALKPFDQT